MDGMRACRSGIPSSAPSCLRPRRQAGTTFIETLVVLAILSILVATAVPSFSQGLSRHRAATATNDLLHGIALTRSEAIRRGRRVYMAPETGHWRDGWVIFVDRNDDRAFDPSDELITRHESLPASTSITNTSGAATEPFTDRGSPKRTYILFDAGGHARQRNGAYGIGGMAIIDRHAGGATIRSICVSAYGRARVVLDRASC